MKQLLIICFVISVGMHASVVLAQNKKTMADQLTTEAQRIFESTEAPDKAEFEISFQKLRQAISIDPQNYDAFVNLSKAYRKYSVIYSEDKAQALTFRKEAKELIKKAIALAPNRPEAYHVYYKLLDKKREKEETDLVKSVLYKTDPNHPDVLIMKGYDLIDNGEAKEGTDFVLKGAEGLPGEGSTGHAKERLEKYLTEKGHEKEAAEVTDSINHDDKFYRGVWEISQGKTEIGTKLVKEATDGDYTKLSLKKKDYFAEVLENKKMYKESADMYEMMDREKYKDKIKDLRAKSKKSK